MIKKIGNDVSPATSGQNAIIDGKIDVIDGLHDVPSQNSTDNDNLRDVIGNKTDYVTVPYSSGVNSIASFLRTGYFHIHGASFLYPYKANPVTLTSGGTPAWVESGNIIEVIPANTITKAFDLHWCSLSAISATLFGVIDIFSGAEGAEIKIGSIDVVRTANFSREGAAPVQIPQQPANTRISCRFIDSTTSAQTVGVRFYGHVYDTSLT